MRSSFLRILIGGVSIVSVMSIGTTQAKIGNALAEFPTIACTTNPAFTANSCNLCYDGGNVKVGERLTGLFDTWTNANSTAQLLYKDEQMMPDIKNLGGGSTEWSSTPNENDKVWRYTTEVVWTPSSATGSRSQFFLMPNDKVKFLEADTGAGYNLVKTDKKSGDAVGLVRYPTIYRNIDEAGNESEKQTNYECVIYKASVAVAAPPTPVTPTPKPTPVTPTPKPTPAQVTTPKTGPETLLLIAAAFFIAFGMMFSLRKEN